MRRWSPARMERCAPISRRCRQPWRSGWRRAVSKARVHIAFEEPPPSGAEMVDAQPSAAGDACGNAARRRARSGFQPGAVARPRRRLADAGGQDGDDRRAAAIALQADRPRPQRAHAPGGGSRRARLGREPDQDVADRGGRTRRCWTSRPAAILPTSRDSGCSPRRSSRCRRCSTGQSPTYARERAQALAEDHARVRAAAAGSARVTVEPVLPADVIGLYVLVPAVH